MFVIKRNGSLEEVNFNKVVNRLKYITNEHYVLTDISVHSLAQTVISGLHDKILTKDIDIHSANICASWSIKNHQYGILAGRIIINNHHKNTLTSFKDKMDKLYLRKDNHGNNCPLLDEKFYKFVIKYQKEIESKIDYSRDFLLDYFSFKTLERSYLLKVNNEIVERPQDMFMRVAIFLHMIPKLSKEKSRPVLEKIFETYDLVSNKYFTHATPTLFNAGTTRPGSLSCFLLGTEDSLEGIMKTASDCAQISKWAGGIGFHISNWRSKGALIRGTNGTSSGIIPFLKIFNDVARAFNQGGKRPGSFAVYIEMHHPDILDFLQLRRNHGEENLRCRDLFLGLWVCDLFMERVKNNEMWSLFDPSDCPRLTEVYGEEYNKLYFEYEEKKMYREQIPAREIWKAVFVSQKESGIPYILYKDHVNRHNNQSNIGVVKSSNLCVSGDTIILTDKGYQSISMLTKTGRVHRVWNGEEFTHAIFGKTGENKELIEVTVRVEKREHSNNRLSELEKAVQLKSDVKGDLKDPLGLRKSHVDYKKIKCTPYHKFILADDEGNEKIIEAKDLLIGDRLISWRNPVGNLLVDSWIENVKPLETKEDTYCFNEPKKHRGVFNGVMLGNCAEIVEVSNSNEYACCTLASICLSMFVEDMVLDGEDRTPNNEFPRRPVFNYKKLIEVVQVIVRNLNQVIDRNWYPTLETEKSNNLHRPLGIGVQGLADVFYKFRCTYDSDLARDLNKRIFETIYYAATSTSTKLSREIYKSYVQQLATKQTILVDKKEYTKETLPKTIGSYSTMTKDNGSPLYNGKFHWELYGLQQEDLLQKFDWESLREHIKTFGIRNSLLIALMPTASTSQIMGNIESIEPLTSNIFKRQTLAGEFIVINKYLMNDLNELGLWNEEMENFVKLSNGSIQNIQGIPENIKELYRTVWELSQQHIIDLAADRQPFVDQSQSMNLFIEDLTFSKFNSMHFYSWSKQLKTGCYYLRTRPAVQAQKFTAKITDNNGLQKTEVQDNRTFEIPTQNEEEICLVCSS
jgi:ribonucleotide reductase alpha subunit